MICFCTRCFFITINMMRHGFPAFTHSLHCTIGAQYRRIIIEWARAFTRGNTFAYFWALGQGRYTGGSGREKEHVGLVHAGSLVAV